MRTFMMLGLTFEQGDIQALVLRLQKLSATHKVRQRLWIALYPLYA